MGISFGALAGKPPMIPETPDPEGSEGAAGADALVFVQKEKKEDHGKEKPPVFQGGSEEAEIFPPPYAPLYPLYMETSLLHSCVETLEDLLPHPTHISEGPLKDSHFTWFTDGSSLFWKASIQTDNGPEFVSSVTQLLAKSLNIFWHFHIPYDPQSSGKVERANRSLKQILTKLSLELQLDWLKLLPLALLCLQHLHTFLWKYANQCIPRPSSSSEPSIKAGDLVYISKNYLPQTSSPTKLSAKWDGPYPACATFEDVVIFFSQEELEFLSQAQRLLYLHVMLENFALINSVENPCEPSKCKDVFHGKPQQRHTEERPYRCRECRKSFKEVHALTVHQRVHTRERPYRCRECRKSFKRGDALAAYQSVHTGERPYICGECGRSFTRRAYLVSHCGIHTGVKSYECNECGKTFRQKSVLLRHQVVHNGERPYECFECGKSFKQERDLTVHQRVHTGERPYKCRECRKSFKQRDALTVHQQVHTGERPFRCGECGKSFTQHANLVGHSRVHTGEKSYECSECGKAFRYRANVVHHQETHKEKGLYECEQCGKVFGHKTKKTTSVFGREALGGTSAQHFLVWPLLLECAGGPKRGGVGQIPMTMEVLGDPTQQACVTFEDVVIYFSQEEWEFLSTTQRLLYLSVMLETFALVTSLGCEYGIEDEETSVQSFSLKGMSHLRIPKPGIPTQDTHPCDILVPVLKDIVHLAEPPMQKLCLAGACARLPQTLSHRSPEKPQKMDKDPNSFLERDGLCVSGKPFGYDGLGKEFPPLLDLLSPQVLPKGEKLSNAEFGEAFHHGKSNHKLVKCRKSSRPLNMSFHNPRGYTEKSLYEHSSCEKEFHDDHSLTHHQRTHTGERPYECRECGKSFKERFSLIAHQRVHTGERPYQCRECGKCFRRGCFLTIHRRVHTGERPYECRECGKSFRERCSLTKHKRVHTGERPYKCGKCGKSFTQRTHLVSHSTIHTGEKSYECNECGKTFRQKSVLIRHQVVHNGERPYECGECGKSFNQRSNLISHWGIHTGEKSYECSECGKTFRQKSVLIRHQVVHNGERPYECKQCGKSFKRGYALTVHQRVHLEKGLIRMESVRNPASEEMPLLYATGFSLEKDLMNATKVHLLQPQHYHAIERPRGVGSYQDTFRPSSNLTQQQRVHAWEQPQT
ncbi:zinc finger protein 551-like [Perognathus longimembris pacificus]|uniref:zinc finger protein 551-like n=1 Tax=Perognathus longimembris pacificus TaxID=214514 RepID=UPI002018897F|nr:zinc finger protein 551-like [Perognathus longimembris pacificus]